MPRERLQGRHTAGHLPGVPLLEAGWFRVFALISGVDEFDGFSPKGPTFGPTAAPLPRIGVTWPAPGRRPQQQKWSTIVLGGTGTQGPCQVPDRGRRVDTKHATHVRTHSLTCSRENTSKGSSLIHTRRHTNTLDATFDVPIQDNRYKAAGKSSYPDHVPTPTESSDAGSIPISPFEDSSAQTPRFHQYTRKPGVTVRVTAGGKCNCSDLTPPRRK